MDIITADTRLGHDNTVRVNGKPISAQTINDRLRVVLTSAELLRPQRADRRVAVLHRLLGEAGLRVTEDGSGDMLAGSSVDLED